MTLVSNIPQTKSGKVALQLPLHSAIASGNRSKMTRLLEGNTNIDAQDQNGQTTLHLAIRIGKVAFVGLLLEHGANAQG